MMKQLILILLMVVSIGSYAQKTKVGTVTIDGNTWTSYTTPNYWTGGVDVEYNSGSSGTLKAIPYTPVLVPSTPVSTSAPIMYASPATIHFQNKLAVNGEVRLQWIFYKNWYKSMGDREYRDMIIKSLQKTGEIQKNYSDYAFPDPLNVLPHPE